jgi:hypothetical protein
VERILEDLKNVVGCRVAQIKKAIAKHYYKFPFAMRPTILKMIPSFKNRWVGVSIPIPTKIILTELKEQGKIDSVNSYIALAIDSQLEKDFPELFKIEE